METPTRHPARTPGLVSVILPNYNHAASLPLSLGALRAQTYPSIEVLLVDDGSTDGSAELARRLGARVLSTPRNQGPAAARNLGAAHASGQYLLFVDSDVAVAPQTVARAVELVDDPRAGAVCGILEDTPLVRDSLLQECRCLQAHYWRTSSEGTVSFLFSALCMMRAEIFDEIGPFDEHLRQTEEVEYGQRLSSRYEVRLTSALSGRHRDDDRLWPLLRKVFHRCRLRVPLYAQRRRYARGFETASRIWGSIAALAAPLLVPLLLLTGAAGALVPLALLAGSVASDWGMYRFVYARRGVRFGLFFTGLQYLLNVAIAVGGVAGVVQWLVSRSFRTLYDHAPQPAPRPPTGPRTPEEPGNPAGPARAFEAGKTGAAEARA